MGGHHVSITQLNIDASVVPQFAKNLNENRAWQHMWDRDGNCCTSTGCLFQHFLDTMIDGTSPACCHPLKELCGAANMKKLGKLVNAAWLEFCDPKSGGGFGPHPDKFACGQTAQSLWETQRVGRRQPSVDGWKVVLRINHGLPITANHCRSGADQEPALKNGSMCFQHSTVSTHGTISASLECCQDCKSSIKTVDIIRQVRSMILQVLC